LPSSPLATQSGPPLAAFARSQGKAVLGFEQRQNQTCLAHLYQSAPVRVLFPTPAKDDITTAILVTTSGGLTGGDHLEIESHLGAQCQALVMGQAAEKIYRSPGQDTHIDITLSVADNAWLEWLPQETIIHEAARLRRQTTVHLTASAQILAAEILVFGRHAHGEVLTQGLIQDRWDVFRDGQRIWSDCLHLEHDLQEILAHPACFDGAQACATLLWHGGFAADGQQEQRDQALLDFTRSLLEKSASPCAATMVNGLLILRWLGEDSLTLRKDFAAFWSHFRAAKGSLPAQMPRLWEV